MSAATRPVDGAVAPRVEPLPLVVWPMLAVVLLAAVAALAGLFLDGGEGPRQVTTVRGGEATLFGSGLYEYDTRFTGAGNRGTDAVLLVLGLPLLLVSLALYRRGSLPGALLLLGVIAYVWYVYANYALGVAHNELFLLYIALFGLALFALVRLFAQVATEIPPRAVEGTPRRGLAAFMFLSALVLIVVWGAPVVAALVDDRPPERLDTYTTLVTHVLDLGIIMPAALIGGVLILRRQALGLVIAAAILVTAALLAPLIATQTYSQVEAGEEFTAAEIIGPMGGFVALSLLSLWALTSILRAPALGAAHRRGPDAPP